MRAKPTSKTLGAKRPDLFSAIFLLFVFWFTSNLPGWVLVVGGPPPVISYLAFLGFGIVVAIVRTSQRLPFMRSQAWLQTRGIWLWINIWIMWTICSYLYSSQSEVATQRLITSLEMAAMLGVFLYLISLLENKRALGLVLAAVVALGTVLNILDFITPSFSTVPGRSAGLYLNPTISGFILVLAMTAALPLLSLWLRWILILAGGVGILLTFSRASWLLLIVSIVWLFWGGYLGMRRQRSVIGIAALAVVAMFVYALMAGWLAEIILNTPLSDYLSPNTLGRLGAAGFANDFSANERNSVNRLALEYFIQGDNPFLGHGLAFTHEWEFRVSTHNMYLMFLVEGGLLGLAVYVSMFTILLKKATGISLLIVSQLLIFSLFSHNILDSPGRVFFIALIASGALSSTLQTSFSHKPSSS
jgi:O-antigen ligase